MDKVLCKNTEINKSDEEDEISKEYLEAEKSNNKILVAGNSSNPWWANDNEGEKLDSRQRWSFGSDISIETPESIQTRLCCSPVDEFDSTVSSENEDLIVNSTDERNGSYKNYIQLSPACSPTFNKVSCNSDDKKQSKSHDVDTADDELIDYSKRYTTDSSMLGIENKHTGPSQVQQRQRRNIVVNSATRHVPEKRATSNNRSKVDLFGDYAETDLDQPTNYSLRYAEEDSDEEEEEENPRFYTNNEQEDTVKTYYTEGTPSNFSTATSMSDLLSLEEGEGAACKRHLSREQRQEVIEKSEKAVKDNKNRIRRKYISEDAKVPVLEEINEIKVYERKLEKPVTPPQSPAEPCEKEKENKTVTFNTEENYAQETPLMFSRSSSLDSLSEFDQTSIQDDQSSVISDFSHRTSGAVSPSDLPDSPTQTVPSSPNKLKQMNFQNQQPQHFPSELEQPQNLTHPQQQKQNFHHQQQSPLPNYQPQKQIFHNQQQQQQNFHDQQSNFHGHQKQLFPKQQHQQTFNNEQQLHQNFYNQQQQRQQIFHSQQREQHSLDNQQELKVPIRVPVRKTPTVQQSHHKLIDNKIQSVDSLSRVSHEQQPIYLKISVPTPPEQVSVFEDGLVSFAKEETSKSSSKVPSSAASCLSALTIDDDDEEDVPDTREIISKIAAIRVRSSAAGMHQAPMQKHHSDVCESGKMNYRQPQQNKILNRHHMDNKTNHCESRSKEQFHHVHVEQDSDHMVSYSNEILNNRYKDTLKEHWYHEEYLKNDNRYHTSRSLSKSPIAQRKSERTVIPQKPIAVEEVVAVDTVTIYCTEDTPTFISPFGSQSNLSALSVLSFSDDDNAGDLQAQNPTTAYEQSLATFYETDGNRADAFGSDANSESSEDEIKCYDDDEGSSSLGRRIDVSPFDSQINLANFSLLRIEEENEDELDEESQRKMEETNDETDRSPDEDSYDANAYERLSYENSDCSDDDSKVLEEYIKAGVTKLTRRAGDRD